MYTMLLIKMCNHKMCNSTKSLSTKMCNNLLHKILGVLWKMCKSHKNVTPQNPKLLFIKMCKSHKILGVLWTLKINTFHNMWMRFGTNYFHIIKKWKLRIPYSHFKQKNCGKCTLWLGTLAMVLPYSHLTNKVKYGCTHQ